MQVDASAAPAAPMGERNAGPIAGNALHSVRIETETPPQPLAAIDQAGTIAQHLGAIPEVTVAVQAK